MSQVQRHRKGFTLVELLVVVGIIALLISILLPALARARQNAQMVSCLARIKQLSLASLMYANENKGYLPPVSTSGQLGGSYGANNLVWPVWGSYGYITPYLSPVGLTNTMTGVLDMFVCPSLIGNPGYQPTGICWSYRYHRQLGGDDSQRALEIGVTSNYIFVPWKLAQITDASDTALLTDGNLQTNTPPTAGNITVTWDGGSEGHAAGQNYQSASYNGGVTHMTQYPPNTFSSPWGQQPYALGYNNVAFCDGSARSVRVTYNAYPYPAWENVIFDPYHPYTKW